jgi:hypothetical protein
MKVSVAVSSFASLALCLVAATADAAPANTGSVSKTVEPNIAVRPPRSKRDSVKKKNEKEDVQFGFLTGVGFPRPLSAEVMLKIADTVSIGGEYSAMPSTTVGAVKVGYRAYAVDLRIFPLQNAFFFGARMLRQHLDSSGSITVVSTGTTYSGSLSMDTWFVNPRMGFLWTWSSGLSLGMDAGLQIPMSHSETLTLPTALPPGATIPTSVTSVGDTLGKKVLPTVTLLQLGMLF